MKIILMSQGKHDNHSPKVLQDLERMGARSIDLSRTGKNLLSREDFAKKVAVVTNQRLVQETASTNGNGMGQNISISSDRIHQNNRLVDPLVHQDIERMACRFITLPTVEKASMSRVDFAKYITCINQRYLPKRKGTITISPRVIQATDSIMLRDSTVDSDVCRPRHNPDIIPSTIDRRLTPSDESILSRGKHLSIYDMADYKLPKKGGLDRWNEITNGGGNRTQPSPMIAGTHSSVHESNVRRIQVTIYRQSLHEGNRFTIDYQLEIRL